MSMSRRGFFATLLAPLLLPLLPKPKPDKVFALGMQITSEMLEDNDMYGHAKGDLHDLHQATWEDCITDVGDDLWLIDAEKYGHDSMWRYDEAR